MPFDERVWVHKRRQSNKDGHNRCFRLVSEKLKEESGGEVTLGSGSENQPKVIDEERWYPQPSQGKIDDYDREKNGASNRIICPEAGSIVPRAPESLERVLGIELRRERITACHKRTMGQTMYDDQRA